jgi:MoxR-like ATPase
LVSIELFATDILFIQFLAGLLFLFTFFKAIISSETSLEQLIGNVVFESEGFTFVDGPLVHAVREGCVFLADEFNLLSPAVMLSLVPFLTARPGEVVETDLLPSPLKIPPGFMFVATGNADTERNRERIPDYVRALIRQVNVIIIVCKYIKYLGITSKI